MGIQYDPVKRSLGRVFNANPALRILFYRLLDLLLLRAWYITRELRRWARENHQAKVLDAGSGFGQYVFRMAQEGLSWTVKGIDIKTEQVEDCNVFFKKIGLANRVQFAYADLTTFNEPDTYDLILSVDVMEHIEEDELVFRNFHSSMRAGGMLLISTPSDQGGSDVHDHDHESFIDEHVRDGYNTEDIRQKLVNAGFSRVETAYSYGWAGSLSWKMSMKFPLLAINASRAFFILLPFYYLVAYPICYILNHIDLAQTNNTGTGLIVKAWK